MPDVGFIKLYRKTLDNPIVCKDADYFAVWCYLLLNATHTEVDMLFNGKKITLQKGQLITGRLSIVKAFSLSESKVQRILKTLENEQQIEQQTCSKNRLITVLNWSLYQGSEQQNKQRVNNKRTTNEQPVNTNKNDKNVRMKEYNNIGADKPPTHNIFKPPVLDEVKAYCKERNKGVDPDRFINFYASKGWMVGKNKMKDWKACIRTWENNNRASPKSGKDFEQRTYAADHFDKDRAESDKMLNEFEKEI